MGFDKISKCLTSVKYNFDIANIILYVWFKFFLVIVFLFSQFSSIFFIAFFDIIHKLCVFFFHFLVRFLRGESLFFPINFSWLLFRFAGVWFKVACKQTFISSETVNEFVQSSMSSANIRRFFLLQTFMGKSKQSLTPNEK